MHAYIHTYIHSDMHTCKLPHRRRLGAKQADLITYNVAISACEKAAEWEPALSLLSNCRLNSSPFFSLGSLLNISISRKRGSLIVIN